MPKRVLLEAALDHPPSINHYWRQDYASRRTYISERGRQYRNDMAWRILSESSVRNFADGVAVQIWWAPPDKRRRDIDNVLKVLLDTLQHSRLIDDDCQVGNLEISKMPPRKPGCAIVRVTTLE